MLEFKKEASLSNQIEKFKKITKITSIIRLILALALVVFAVCLISLDDYILYSILTGIFLVLFICVVLYTNRYYNTLNHLQKKKQVYLSHKYRRDKLTSGFYDTGAEFLDTNDYKQSDLDIFGNKSLFQYLSIAKTKLGRKALAKQLSNPDKKPKEFTECIYEMTEVEEVFDIEAALLSFSGDAKKIDYDQFNSVAGKNIKIKPIYFLPVLTFLATITYLILVITKGFNPYYLIILLASNFFLSKICLKNEVYSLNAIMYYNLCDAYISLSNVILKTKLENSFYKALQDDITKELPNLYKLRGIYSTLSVRKNIIISIIANGLCIFDFWIILFYNNVSKRVKKIDKIFNSIAEIEVMLSFANIGIDGDVYSIPEYSNEIEAINIHHPLLKNSVGNSLTFSGGIILTGSNMSGKTTFMRALGVNQTLYNAGSIVSAESYKAPRIPIFTSLRANDMLVEGISTFYAEILRMKLMNEAIENSQCLILVDEIFKGTNAYERISASLKVIEKFNSKNVFFIISTHDFELCDANNIANYHFSEDYLDDKITFDYLLKSGKCETKNALYLLKMAKII